ncbi:hypothetical protein DPX16_4146 [Anabarilius grahami]|uniref:Uncharacterized protein n=1 Tax=Anabarilius grahami TaxID=495550 RepID=A0A3N0XYH9_ANAGA|nr:hypothetical protein DPX16_4146 [Anabarilius grahami]
MLCQLYESVCERTPLSREIAIGFLPSPQFDIDGFVGNGVPGVEGISGHPRGSDYRGRRGGVLSQAIYVDKKSHFNVERNTPKQLVEKVAEDIANLLKRKRKALESWFATKRQSSECFRAAFLTEQLKIGPAAIGASNMLTTRPNHHPKPSRLPTTERKRESEIEKMGPE